MFFSIKRSLDRKCPFLSIIRWLISILTLWLMVAINISTSKKIDLQWKEKNLLKISVEIVGVTAKAR